MWLPTSDSSDQVSDDESTWPERIKQSANAPTSDDDSSDDIFLDEEDNEQYNERLSALNEVLGTNDPPFDAFDVLGLSDLMFATLLEKHVHNRPFPSGTDQMWSDGGRQKDRSEWLPILIEKDIVLPKSRDEIRGKPYKADLVKMLVRNTNLPAAHFAKKKRTQLLDILQSMGFIEGTTEKPGPKPFTADDLPLSVGQAERLSKDELRTLLRRLSPKTIRTGTNAFLIRQLQIIGAVEVPKVRMPSGKLIKKWYE